MFQPHIVELYKKQTCGNCKEGHPLFNKIHLLTFMPQNRNLFWNKAVSALKYKISNGNK